MRFIELTLNETMAKKRAKSKRTPPVAKSNGAWLRTVIQIVLVLALVTGLGFGFHRLNRAAANGVAAQPRYAVPVAEMQFDSPEYLDRKAFLREVRYLANLPEAVQSIDPALSSQLKVALEKHPSVRSFDGVAVRPDGTVRIELRFRQPVLAFEWGQMGLRSVDAEGILLPRGAPLEGVAKLLNARSIASAEEGKPWPEAEVLRAAEFASRQPLRTLERTANGWKLLDADGQSFTLFSP